MPKPTFTGMRSFLARSSCIALVAVGGSTISANAQSETVTQVEFDGAKIRVNSAARLRMLNEKLAGSVCRISADETNADAREDLTKAHGEFTQIMKALRESDPAIGIPTPERKPRVLSKIWDIELDWVKVKYAGNQIIKDIRIPEYVYVTANLTSRFGLALKLDKMESEVVARYTNPAELLTRDAFTISLMARQRKLIQEISKLTCAVSTNQPGFGSMSNLREKVELFDKSLKALQTGLPAAGISKPPSKYVAERLEQLNARWEEISGDAIANAQTGIDLQALTDTYDEFHDEINNLVAVYMLSTPGQDDLYTVPLQAYVETVLIDWTTDANLVAAVKEQNAKNADLTKKEIRQLDYKWRAETLTSDDKPIINAVLQSPLSIWLKDKKEESTGLITDVLLMDNKGLNVAQTNITTDVWQGDEAQWKKTYENGSGDTQITNVILDQDAGVFKTNVTLPVRDPENGQLIGAITFGIDVQSFL